MTSLQKFIRDISEIEKIYRDFTSSMGLIEGGDLRSINAIKRRLDKVDLREIENFLESIKISSTYNYYAKRAEPSLQKYKEMLEVIDQYTPKKTTPEELSLQKFEGIKKAYQSLISHVDNLSAQVALDEIKRLERRFNTIPLENIEDENQREFFQMKMDLADYREAFIRLSKSEKYGPRLKELVDELVVNYLNVGQKNERSDNLTFFILDKLENIDNIDFFEPYIKRILSGRMKKDEFLKLFDIIKKMGRSKSNESNFMAYLNYLQEYAR